MHFYRYLAPLRALTFDLDDTLYHNKPVINNTEQKIIQFIQNYHPSLHKLSLKEHQNLYNKLRLLEPKIYHDVNYCRWKSIEITMRNAGLKKNKAHIGANAAMEVVSYWRSRINISSKIHNILTTLGSKWPLVAITNGNVDLNICGLSDYFKYILRAGVDGRAKPWKDMYQLAAKKLKLPLKNILHVGDNLITDIIGANSCGMQTCWLNYNNNNNLVIYKNTKNIKFILPHLEISRLAFLENLL